MRVLVDALTVRMGGGLVVLEALMSGCVRERPGYEWHLVTNDKTAEALNGKLSGITIHSVRSSPVNTLTTLFFYLVQARRLVGTLRADVLFSQTNLLPLFNKTPSLLLVQNAGFFSRCFHILNRKDSRFGFAADILFRGKTLWCTNSARRADRIVVQTRALAESMGRKSGIDIGKIVVVPHGTGVCTHVARKTDGRGEHIRIGYVSNYGVQKNFEDLFRAVAVLAEEGMDLSLILTLGDDAKCQRLLRYAAQLGLSDVIENHGSLPPDAMESLYDSLDLLVFPSLCESFGFPLVEAMARGIPLIVSDIPSNREVAGRRAGTYTPGFPEELATKIRTLAGDSLQYAEASLISLERSSHFSWNRAAQETCRLIDAVSVKSTHHE